MSRAAVKQSLIDSANEKNTCGTLQNLSGRKGELKQAHLNVSFPTVMPISNHLED